jgi:Anti-sigma factor NepR
MADHDKKVRKKVTPQNPDRSNTLSPTIMKPNMSDLIGTRLKLYYDEVADQPVPDRFLKLLAELENKTNPKKEE